LIAFAIPGRVKIREEGYLKELKELYQRFLNIKPIKGNFISRSQLKVLEEIKQKTDDAETPLQKMEHNLAPLVNFFILPLFALVNTGIHLHGDIFDLLVHPISLGIMVGLIGGKFVGIIGVSWILVKLKIAELQEGISMRQLAGVALIAGIGFTMSLFITELAFESDEDIFIAKISILFTSVLAAIMGIFVLKKTMKKLPNPINKKNT
jgi:NhaA family Na+:H+ antiporter